MEPYIENVLKTKTDDFVSIYDRLNSEEMIDILHGAIGIATESGELLDAIKKSVFYGKELDKVNLGEELGDIFFYCAVIAYRLNVSFEEIQEKNIKKLKARYPEGFTEKNAENRDLEKERNILEGEM